MKKEDKILILDFGSQYTQLIARKIRELHVYSEIHPYSLDISSIQRFQPKAIVLSGGPQSVHESNSPKADPQIFQISIPILGICYGAQWTAQVFGGKVESSQIREYGRTELSIIHPSPLFDGLPPSFPVWMSHGDHIEELSQAFEAIASSLDCSVAAFQNLEQKIFGLQFHPEVHHSQFGKEILSNFLFSIAQCKPSWNIPHWIDEKVQEIRQQIGSAKVISALSGGVDSSVASVLVHKAVGDQLTCIFVDNGLLRSGEKEQVQEVFQKHFHIPLIVIDGRKKFLEALKRVTD
ncbi:MAG: glutamine-hydrolyzing GMP synthase, partial [Planctomycetota bacterium]